jgi:hypothetical protein
MPHESTRSHYAASGNLVFDQTGSIHGTTSSVGVRNHGTVYKLSPVTEGKKKGTWTEKILYSFMGGREGGLYPYAGVVPDAAGNIYGTTSTGGNKAHAGTVFELAFPLGKGRYKDRILWSFNGKDGDAPFGGLVLDSTGDLYGTTYNGRPTWHGPYTGDGVVFEVTS